MNTLIIKRRIKYLFPLVGICIVFFAFFSSHIKNSHHQIKQFSALLNKVSGLRYQGTTPKGDAYVIQSARGTEISANEMIFEDINGSINTQKGHGMALEARYGLFNKTDKEMHLSGDVQLTHENGLKLSTTSATLDFKTGGAHGKTPIKGVLNGAVIKANSFKVNQGTEIVFLGDPELILPAH